MLKQLRREIKRLARVERAKVSRLFFKTGPGQYGEGDVFVGLTVPQMRSISKKYLDLKFTNLQTLLDSKIHEERFISLTILSEQYSKSPDAVKKQIVNFYLKNSQKINNWDLVDTSAPYILGKYLLNKPKAILYKLASSNNLWEKRIAIVATQELIRNNQFADTLKISEILLKDTHDLIHKAVGWMLREVGKRDLKSELKFLDKFYLRMPRTALRYAIERFPSKLKAHYMKKE